MIIHFIAAKHTLDRDCKHLREIRDTIVKSGHHLTRDWLDKEHDIIRSSEDASRINWWISTKKDLRTLARADLVIAETTEESLSVGYQIAVAVQLKKPILILVNNDALSTTARFSNGISPDFDNFATIKQYDPDNLHAAIEMFIDKNKVEKKDMRFNFFINSEIDTYLKRQAYITGKNKSKVLRDLVLKEINK